MSLDRFQIDRRSFIKAAAPLAIGLTTIARGQVLIERGHFNDGDVGLVQEQLLKLVNEERGQAGLSQLQLDALACQVAGEHAGDMVTHHFLNHWGSDGRKPYQRYSFAGGTDATRENVASANNIQSLTSVSVAEDFRDMHRSMTAELPPNDGHRRTILYPQLTHVGFGVAMQGRDLRLDEIYVARYVNVDPIARQARPKATVFLRGRILDRRYVVNDVSLYHEPLPSPPAADWLRVARPYALPSEFERLLPRLPRDNFYEDGSRGSIELRSDGSFFTRVPVSKDPGINTIEVWLRAGDTGTAFPATQICVRVE